MTKFVFRLALLLTPVCVLLMGGTLALGGTRTDKIIVAYGYHATEGQHYFLFIDTGRNFYNRHTPPIPVWRQPLFVPGGQWALLPYGTSNALNMGYYNMRDGTFRRLPQDFNLCVNNMHAGRIAPDGRAAVFSCQTNTQANLPSDERIGATVLDLPTGYMSSVITEAVNDVVWSPDGAYWIATGDSLRVFNREGQRMIAPLRGVATSYAAWSPDSRQIAYTFQNGLYIHDIATDESRLIYRAQSINSPRWSPQGDAIAVYRADEWRVYVIDIATGHATLIDEADGEKIGNAQEFAWSPTAPMLVIAQVNNVFLRNAVYLANADSTQVIQLSPRAIIPSWSPDGRYVVFTATAVSDTATNDRLSVLDTWAGNAPVAYGDDGGKAHWSADSRMMAYIRRDFSGVGAARQLYGWHARPTLPPQSGYPLLRDTNYSIITFEFLTDE